MQSTIEAEQMSDTLQAVTENEQDGAQAPRVFDVVVIGAGLAGIYSLYRLRELGFSAVALEAADGIGGTWYWNRYPGARVDIQSVEYSYSFDKQLQQDWNWSEIMASQPELERYINYVVDRHNLRRNIQLSARVATQTYDDRTAQWTVETESGDQYTSRFVICATGCLSAPLEPAIEGLKSFAGTSLYTSRFPKEGFDFTGKRVAVVGTGSSGVQCIPVIAEQAKELYVFQRSAAYTRPSPNRPLSVEERAKLKADYDNIRRRQRESFYGTIFFPILPVPGDPPITMKILETPMEERLAAIDKHGWTAPWSWSDIMTDLEANEAARELYGELVRRTVKDPETAESLIPKYPLGCKRLIVDNGYYECFNRPNVTLVDLRKGPIKSIGPKGIDTAQGFFDLDVIVYATGFDAMTGSLTRMDIRGSAGRELRDLWDHEGPVTYLGLQVEGFPNLFMIAGPGSPGPRSNMLGSIEQQVEWITDCFQYVHKNGYRTIEPGEGAASRWGVHTSAMVEGTVMMADSCNSWYLGSNIAGKKRIYMPYVGGLRKYREICDQVMRDGYKGFLIE